MWNVDESKGVAVSFVAADRIDAGGGARRYYLSMSSSILPENDQAFIVKIRHACECVVSIGGNLPWERSTRERGERQIKIKDLFVFFVIAPFLVVFVFVPYTVLLLLTLLSLLLSQLLHVPIPIPNYRYLRDIADSN